MADEIAEPRKKNGKMALIVSLVAVAVIFFVIGYFAAGAGNASVDTGSASGVGQKTIAFLNDNVLSEGTTATLLNATPENGMYKLAIRLSGNGQQNDYELYVSSDGRYLFTYNPIDMAQSPQEQPEATDGMPKSDSPVVDVFVMSYCPYGLQMQKALIPAWDLLKDMADIRIRFVSYAMHGKIEVDENTRQYCIQKEQYGKYIDYLSCFTETGNATACMADAGIGTEKVESCTAATDEEFGITAKYNHEEAWVGNFPPYDVDRTLNNQYGVQGSPTFIINGKEASVTRSPQAVKNAICSAFNTPPDECDQQLSTAATSPGIGGGSGSASGATCG